MAPVAGQDAVTTAAPAPEECHYGASEVNLTLNNSK